MKTTLILAGASALAIAALAVGTLTQHPASAQPAYAAPGAMAAQSAGRGQEAMTLAQFQMRQRRRMMKADADHDGRISLAEWTAWHEAHPGAHAGHGDPARQFDRLDLNHDGYITPDEIDAMSARRFSRMDANHDGVVTSDERSAVRGGGEDAPQPLSPQ
ncbi:MAG: EF-hand domain-containing protein [Caulobacteraceae bacterium]